MMFAIKNISWSFTTSPTIILTICLLFFSACQQEKVIEIHKSFYYWKTTFNWQETDDNLVTKTLKINKLYVHLFDVDWQNGKAQPSGTLSFRDSLPQNLTIIPTIFITQNVVLQLAANQTNQEDTHEVDSLAKKIVIKVFNMLQRQQINKINELQIDCDWTLKSQQIYFKLLKSIKTFAQLEEPNIMISCTIRLYPMKYYQKMGIPPVDKGLLMCYNLNNPTILSNENAILSYKNAKSYLSSLPDYPLPLDIGLPIFAWAVQFRNGKFLRLLHEVRHDNLLNSTNISNFKSLDKNIYQAIQTTTLNNHENNYENSYEIRAGDVLKIDEIQTQELQQTANLIYENLSHKTKYQQINIVLFHYDNKIIENYNIQEVFKFSF